MDFISCFSALGFRIQSRP